VTSGRRHTDLPPIAAKLGLRLQLRWRASFGVRGGFDSLALPPESGAPMLMTATRFLSGFVTW